MKLILILVYSSIVSFILKPNEYGCLYAWTTLENIAPDQLTEDADFGKKNIIFSDEAHFDLGGYVNKQNCRIWGTENSYAYIEKSTHPKRVTVWCRFWSRDIIGLFFFENDQGEAVTVNGVRYRVMLKEILFTKIEEEDIGNIWFQQDGDTCHTAKATVDVLRSVFEDCIIRRGADVVWRSYDLRPLDYYLWGAVKDKCYADEPEIIETLKNSIREAIGEIQLHTIDNVLKNWTDRLGYCVASRSTHLNEIFFHY